MAKCMKHDSTQSYRSGRLSRVQIKKYPKQAALILRTNRKYGDIALFIAANWVSRKKKM